jgi:hypothetical protein
MCWRRRLECSRPGCSFGGRGEAPWLCDVYLLAYSCYTILRRQPTCGATPAVLARTLGQNRTGCLRHLHRLLRWFVGVSLRSQVLLARLAYAVPQDLTNPRTTRTQKSASQLWIDRTRSQRQYLPALLILHCMITSDRHSTKRES